MLSGAYPAVLEKDAWRHLRPELLLNALKYSAAVMTILLCHEMGHFVQAWRYGVYASLPYFIPFPLSPIGTFGAVIAMEPRRATAGTFSTSASAAPSRGSCPR